MIIEELIKDFLREYNNNNDELVNSSQKYYILLNEIAKLIKENISEDYVVKPSCGQGRKSDCPWICIFNKKITNGASNGIYIVFLFKKDMSGFYLSLSLGMQKFKELFKSEWELNLNKVTNYFRKRIDLSIFDNFKINLGSTEKNSRSYGYEKSNICAKLYQDNFENFNRDLKEMLHIYENICNSAMTISYSELITNIISYEEYSILNINEANKEIEKALLEDNDEANIVSLTEINVPIKNERKFVEISSRKIKKKDYIELSKKQTKIGLKGELLVLRYEKERMILSNREDLVEQIRWISEFDDSKGYDIESFDFDKEGNEYRIYIEVKTTESLEKNLFYISYNEKTVLDTMKDKYWIYRVCDIKNNPKFYKINGVDFYNFCCLENYTYKVILK